MRVPPLWWPLVTNHGAPPCRSRARGAPFEFRVGGGQVIKGWDRGIVKMSFGERAVLHIRVRRTAVPN
jgi:FKBP-type peptidyl-prolyl cis-trans isomerase